MAESLFDIFGDSINKQSSLNGPRQPLYNNENLGKTLPGKMVSRIPGKLTSLPKNLTNCTPMKPNEPLKKMGDMKKSFMSNAGLSIQGTPMRQALTPRAVNVTPMIYNDKASKCEEINYEALEFTKPSFLLDNYNKDIFDYLITSEPHIQESPPNTPSPKKMNRSMEFNSSYSDEFFNDDFSNDSIPDSDLDLPDLY